MMLQLPAVVPAFLVAAFASLAFAQFPAPVKYSSVLRSPVNPNITVSYKSPDPGTCTTVFTSQKQFTGYIHLPPSTLAPIQQNYPINTFFWFFEARQTPETAPLTIWINGGPGSSSMIGLFQESGPCEVVQMADGTYGTQSRLWGWDRSSNVIYIDQPTLVGFSYDRLTNWSYNLWDDSYSSVQGPGIPPWIWLNGTFGSNSVGTTNTTAIAAHAIWHFLQTFLATFPEYNPGTRANSTSPGTVGVNLFAESYGGQYGPTFADFFEEQNSKRDSGELSPNSTLEIKLTSLGIMNGLVDELVQAPFWPKFANNNTYGIVALDTVDMFNALSDFNSADGCKAAVELCRSTAAALDPEGDGDVTSVNDACSSADQACNNIMGESYSNANRNFYDIRDELPESFPSDAYLEYLNTATVQQSIGVPVNFTASNGAIFSAFLNTGDEIRGTQLSSIADLLSRGIRVALMYGDADFICNWMGGEAVSLAIAAVAPAYTTAFPAAGYADIVVNSSYIGGAVRQFGNLSFSRIYDSGHLIPAFQPETAFTVFTRIIEGTEISTGEPINLSSYSSQGPANATYMNKVPPQAPDVCWIRDSSTCTNEQMDMALQGKGVVIDGMWFENADDYKPPSTSIIAGVPGTLPATGTSTADSGSQSTSTVPATGVYVATATPSGKKNAAARPRAFGAGTALALVLIHSSILADIAIPLFA